MPWTEPTTRTTGEIITAAKWNTDLTDNLKILRWQGVRKTASTSRNSTTTATDDPHLILPVLANEVWIFDALCSYDDASSGVADIKIGFAAPAGATGFFAPQVRYGTTDAVNINVNETAFGSQVNFGAAAAATVLVAMLSGTIVVSTTAGNLSVQWAQVTSNASNVTMRINSWLRAQRIA